jgi:uncharacterized protein (TIGR02246 family)
VTDGPIRSLLTQYAHAWSQHDRARWLATFADHAVQEDPVGEGERRGKVEIGSFWDGAFGTYEAIDIRVRAIHVVSSEAAMEWTITARTSTEELQFDGVDVFTFTEAPLIASVRAYWERSGRRRRTTD